MQLAASPYLTSDILKKLPLLKKSTIQLLRFHFSLFLLPVFLFALSQSKYVDWNAALLAFFIWHFLVYPSSNGYNAYMDRDTESIGGVQHPLPPTSQLLQVALVLDIVACLLSVLVSWIFVCGIIAYIIASRAYSARNIRLKQYPVIGYLTVIIFQGALTYFLVYHGASVEKNTGIPYTGMLAAMLLIGGFYPLTQIYQHDTDRKDGVTTISMLLGYRGTFVFTAIVYTCAMGVLYLHFAAAGQTKDFFILATIMLPVLVYFFYWAGRVWKNIRAADFRNAMRMNILASACTISGFLIILTRRLF